MPKQILAEPRALAVVNGTTMAPSTYSIETNAHGVADSGTITFPLGTTDLTAQFIAAQPKTITTSTSQAAGAIPILVYAGYPSANQIGNPSIAALNLRFRGVIDTDAPHFNENEVTFSIRSLASLFVSNHTTTASQNQTTIDFISKCAASLGITFNPKLRLGQQPWTLAKVFANDFVVGLRNMKNWDIITACAQCDDVDVWVDRFGTLNYVAPDLVTRQTLKIDYLGGDLTDFSGVHATQFNRKIKVEIRTYNPKKRFTAYTRVVTASDGSATVTQGSASVTSDSVFGTNATNATSTSYNPQTGQSTITNRSGTTSGGAQQSSAGGAVTDPDTEDYIYHIPNLTLDECNSRATAMWRQISMLQKQASIKLPMTPAVLPYATIESFFQMTNAPWASWNDTYWPRRITETFDVQQELSGESEGWDLDITAISNFYIKGFGNLGVPVIAGSGV